MAVHGLKYTDEVVRLSDLFTVQSVIDKLQFKDCLLVGPAVITFLGQSVLRGCTFIGPGEDIIIEIPGARQVLGVLGFSNSEFIDCRFENIGVLGDKLFTSEFRRGVLGL
ncbi:MULTISPECIES: hypothetical protein [unclassified Rathayibacter]|jgi:hypothetical protein|uniref:hypothetical protein n=1 Tax=unclassified Rathayibacter TaxID=2609250 RepID=UPI0011B0AB7B|nr:MULTISPECIES: hypothetical protein [unclassified Rathayibacter]